MNHPEIDGDLGKTLAEFGKQELVDVWCHGCQAFRKMNAVFAKHLNGEIQSCAKCRGLKLKE
jgi:NAD-dependent SIR2 family protein deacetylase